MLKRFLTIAAMGAGLFLISAPLHNPVSGLLGVEEPVFFLIATVVAPVLVAVGIIGSLVVLTKRRFKKRA